MTHQALADEVKASADVVWPLTHSAWGEQGQLHAVLEAAGVQFVGTPPAKAADATDKLRWTIDAVLHAAALYPIMAIIQHGIDPQSV